VGRKNKDLLIQKQHKRKMGIIKKILKIYGIFMIILFLIFTIIFGVLLKETYTIKKLQDEGILYILTDEEKIISIIKLDKNKDLIPYSKEKIITINQDQNPKEVIYTESKDQLILILDISILESSPLFIPPEIKDTLPKTLTKEDIISQLKDPEIPQTSKNNLFIISIPSMFNMEDEDSLKRITNNFEEGKLTIYPPLKIFKILSYIPTEIQKKALQLQK